MRNVGILGFTMIKFESENRIDSLGVWVAQWFRAFVRKAENAIFFLSFYKLEKNLIVLN